VEAGSLEVAIPRPVIFSVSAPSAVFAVFAPAIENLPAGRAPPVSASNS
jgi:hypothetical protein